MAATTLPGLSYRELRDGNKSFRIGFSGRGKANNENQALPNFLTSDHRSPAAEQDWPQILGSFVGADG
ncbi:hypothetical protein ACE10Z_36850 [Bradyrhizobium sp. Pha-3]|uniref:hypothetical protein n=1 Tax=Bradyrhizobium sp. Pha-3 TaxID=208375 RepID=UPI0035D443E1